MSTTKTSFSFAATATNEIYTLSLHDALPICPYARHIGAYTRYGDVLPLLKAADDKFVIFGSGEEVLRSEEHTSELQSRFDLVCRLLLEKKKYRIEQITIFCCKRKMIDRCNLF